MIATMLLAAVLPGFTLVQSTARADWYSASDAHGKAEFRVDVQQCEGFLATTERTLGTRVPRFTYYRVASEGVVAQYTGVYAVGITYRNLPLVISSQECSLHEMAHLVIHEMAQPIQFWDEGMAGFLSGECQSSLSLIRHDVRENRLTWERAVVAFSLAYSNADDMRSWYDASCAFTSYLIGAKSQNLPTLRQFLIGGDFQALFGMSTAQAWDQWLEGSSNVSPSRK